MCVNLQYGLLSKALGYFYVGTFCCELICFQSIEKLRFRCKFGSFDSEQHLAVLGNTEHKVIRWYRWNVPLGEGHVPVSISVSSHLLSQSFFTTWIH